MSLCFQRMSAYVYMWVENFSNFEATEGEMDAPWKL